MSSPTVPQHDIYPSRVSATFQFPSLASPPLMPPSPAPPVPPTPMARDEDEVLKQVLELSARESERHRRQTCAQEDEELARALTESLRTASASPPLPSVQMSPIFDQTTLVSSPVPFSARLPESDVSYFPPYPQPLSMSLSSLDVRDFPTGHSSSSHPNSASQISDDEAMARRLEEEERAVQQREQQQQEERHRSADTPYASAQEPPLPQYEEAVSSPSKPAPIFNPAASLPLLSPSNVSYSAPRSRPPKSGSWSKWSFAVVWSTGSTTSGNVDPLSPPILGNRRLSSTASSNLPVVEEALPTSANHASEPATPGSNQYVDTELLLGVSLGFGVPTISAQLTPMQGPIPNVIALPYGRCPPFHIRAPSWRSLLKLMARLSGTRLEPTIEAMAVVKTAMKLRIVVSFVHHASSEWQTIVYMTIDHPIPANAPTGWKYRNGDTGSLPWSYTLSSPPPFLRDGSDAPMSKFYTIPCTQETPFPTLPINFPDLATYLASALDDSRGAMHDSSSGLRRLAKCIDTFYPGDHEEERSGMRQRLKNFVGIGSRSSRDRNAETFDLVTPFVADDFGR
ncbi:hypothetical protein A0H81_09897 [Grifola frondosa]|uniref:Uncharacterized protein n=1 Tax=Grifola frondosa TaxID=5627 RepID=A0A1C7LZH9_GRIFR|nr:hypothetical protein A0H81_09897 [Grifola frondosa]